MIRKLLPFFGLLLFCAALDAQPSYPNPVNTGPSLPATCSPGGLVPAWFLLTAGGPIATPYYCSAPNTWTAASSGGSGCVPAGSAGQILTDSGAGACTSNTTGTGILTALGVNIGSAGAPVLFNGAGGSPSSITLPAASVTNAMLAGSIANAKLANSSITIAGHSVALGGTQAIACADLTVACITGNQTITLSGNVTGSGTTAITTAIANLAVTNAMIAAGTIDLTAKVTGALPVANGGTAATSLSANLQNSGAVLDTIQGIQTSSTPQFARLGLGVAAPSTGMQSEVDAIGVTGTDAIYLKNVTAATSGVQQWSPRLHLLGNMWNTTSTASHTMEWFEELRPVSNSADQTILTASYSNNGGTNTVAYTYNSGSSTPFQTGNVAIGGGAVTTTSNFNLDLSTNGTGDIQIGPGGAVKFGVVHSTSNFTGIAASLIGWSSTSAYNGTPDSCFGRNGIGVIEVDSCTATTYRDLKFRTNNQTGLTALYNNVATTGMGTPPIYATVALTGQTASIGTTNLQCGGAVCPAGDYRVSVYTVVTSTGTGTLSTTIGWSDPAAARTITSAGIVTTATNFERVDYTIKADGVSNITYATTESVSGTYSIDVDLERLQ